MNAEDFVHLHVHSEYSLLDGSIKVKKLIKEVLAQNYKAIALTDHDGMHGFLEFFLEAQKEKLKPIVGYEANVAFFTQGGKIPFAHLILLAETNHGYKNLIKLATLASTVGKNAHGEARVASLIKFL